MGTILKDPIVFDSAGNKAIPDEAPTSSGDGSNVGAKRIGRFIRSLRITLRAGSACSVRPVRWIGGTTWIPMTNTPAELTEVGDVYELPGVVADRDPLVALEVAGLSEVVGSEEFATIEIQPEIDE